MGMAALLWMYNRRWKRAPLAGNLCVSLLCALAVYFPEWPGLPLYTGIPVLFAFLTTLAREIAKDLQDRPGDKIAGYRTWPLVSGPTRPGQTVLGLHIAIAVLLPLPVFYGYHLSYVILAALLAFPPLVLNGLTLRQVAKAGTNTFANTSANTGAKSGWDAIHEDAIHGQGIQGGDVQWETLQWKAVQGRLKLVMLGGMAALAVGAWV
jgi:4-hydroxybenzoate polyprenyltransferase